MLKTNALALMEGKNILAFSAKIFGMTAGLAPKNKLKRYR